MSNINFELKILDQDYRKIGFWKFDDREIAKFLRIINKKHNLGIIVKEEKSNNRDLKWAA